MQKILDDYISDDFVVKRVWERLGYRPSKEHENIWRPGLLTPNDWRQSFSRAPEVIANRKASVYLTRSIPKEFKQLLKSKLNFSGYSINELYPRRTRRATAVNWLLAWLEGRGESLPVTGPLPKLLPPPINPVIGHPGDRQIE